MRLFFVLLGLFPENLLNAETNQLHHGGGAAGVSVFKTKVFNLLKHFVIDNDGNETKQVSKDENEFRFKPCGYGVQDFASILEAAEKYGTEYVIVEQDQWYDEDPFECAKKSREHLAKLGI